MVQSVPGLDCTLHRMILRCSTDQHNLHLVGLDS